MVLVNVCAIKKSPRKSDNEWISFELHDDFYYVMYNSWKGMYLCLT